VKKKSKNLEKEQRKIEKDVTDLKKSSQSEVEKNDERVEVSLYLEASPLYTLSVVSQEKNEALKALNCIYRAIWHKIGELGGSISLAKPLQVLSV